MSRKQRREATPAKPKSKVALAYVHGAEVTHSWHQSMMAMLAHDVAHDQRLIGGGWLATKYGTGGIVAARNDTARQFVDDMPHCDWLLWIDTDMGFESTSLDRLLEVADPESTPIVGGLCWMMREVGMDGVGGYLVQPAPTIFQWADMNGVKGFQCERDYPRNTMHQVAATGSAFILIHKSAFRIVEQQYGRSWYSPVFNESAQQWISEDLAFCMRANACEIPIHVHTGVQTTHYKSLWLDERVADRLAPIEEQ